VASAAEMARCHHLLQGLDGGCASTSPDEMALGDVGAAAKGDALDNANGYEYA